MDNKFGFELRVGKVHCRECNKVMGYGAGLIIAICCECMIKQEENDE